MPLVPLPLVTMALVRVRVAMRQVLLVMMLLVLVLLRWLLLVRLPWHVRTRRVAHYTELNANTSYARLCSAMQCYYIL
jgi:hypothetical protein